MITITKNNTQITIEHYPKMGRDGWLWYCNYVRDDYDGPRESTKQILDLTKGYYSYAICYAKWLKAYSTGDNIYCREDLYPIFIRLRNKKILEEIGYISPFPKIIISRSELLDI